MSKNTFFISALETYSSTNISILRGLEPVILTGTMVPVTDWSQWNEFFVGLMCFKIR